MGRPQIRFSVVGEIAVDFDGIPIVHVHHHYHGQRNRRHGDAGIERELRDVMNFMEQMRQAVARNTDVVASNELVLKTLSAQLREALDDDDPDAAKAILDQLDANTNNIARAAAENTQAHPAQGSEPITDSTGDEGSGFEAGRSQT